MNKAGIHRLLQKLGGRLQDDSPVEIVLIGGAAGIATGEFPPGRSTLDCDLIRCVPATAVEALTNAAADLAAGEGLSPLWLSRQAMPLDILPDGWQTRTVEVGRFGPLRVRAIGRLDLLATKAYANRVQDREDIASMKPTQNEFRFIRTYLSMLRVPSRRANLDQVAAALRRLDAMEAQKHDET